MREKKLTDYPSINKPCYIYTPDSAAYRKQGVKQFVESAALAFENYPMFNYILGDHSKARDIQIILAASLKASTGNWIGLSGGENDVSLALFFPPVFKGTATLPFLLRGGFRLLPKNSFRALFRLAKYETYAMQRMRKYADQRCWYLYSFTVHPAYQHQGVATATLKPMLDFFDATGQSCFLETNKESNVPLYEHFGFQLMEAGKIPGSEVYHYVMRREPMKQKESEPHG